MQHVPLICASFGRISRQRGDTEQREESTTGEPGGAGAEKPSNGGEEAVVNGDLSKKRVLLEPPTQDLFNLQPASPKEVGGLGHSSETKQTFGAAETRCCVAHSSRSPFLHPPLPLHCAVCVMKAHYK